MCLCVCVLAQYVFAGEIESYSIHAYTAIADRYKGFRRDLVVATPIPPHVRGTMLDSRSVRMTNLAIQLSNESA